jgi:hypothetical protein
MRERSWFGYGQYSAEEKLQGPDRIGMKSNLETARNFKVCESDFIFLISTLLLASTIVFTIVICHSILLLNSA